MTLASLPLQALVVGKLLLLKKLLLALEMTEGMGGAASYFTGKRVNTVKGVVTDSWDVG